MRLSAKKVSRSNGGTFVIIFFLFLLALVMMIPFIYALLQSLKPIEEIFVYPPRFWVTRPTLDNFSLLFRSATDLWVPFSRYVWNSIYIAVGTTAISVLFSSMAAYPLAKHNFKGRNFIFSVMTLSMLFNGTVLFLPSYLLVSALGLTDTHLIFFLTALGNTMGLYLMRQNMVGFPDSILEAARIDGAPERLIFWRMVMPNMKAAVMTLVVFAFSAAWGMSDSLYIYSEELKGLPTLLTQVAAGGIARAGVGAASSVLMMLPPIIVFIITQSNVIEAMTNSGMKD